MDQLQSIDKKRKVCLLRDAKVGNDDGCDGNDGTTNNNKHNKKTCHSTDDSYMFDLSDPIDIVTKLIKESKSSSLDTKMTTTASTSKSSLPSSRRSRIIQLKEEIHQLSKAKEVLETFVEQTATKLLKSKEQEISSQFDSDCPLLSMLHTNNISQILSYLCPREMYAAEMASYTLNEIIHQDQHWQRLKDQHFFNVSENALKTDPVCNILKSRPTRFRNLPIQRSEDGIGSQFARYAGALSCAARQWEIIGEEHYTYGLSDADDDYNIKECLKKSKELKDMPFYPTRNGMATLKRWTTTSTCRNGALFRLSRFDTKTKDHIHIHDFAEYEEHDFQKTFDISRTIGPDELCPEWPEFKKYFEWKPKGKNWKEEGAILIHSMLDDFRLTVLLDDCELLVATGGCCYINSNNWEDDTIDYDDDSYNDLDVRYTAHLYPRNNRFEWDEDQASSVTTSYDGRSRIVQTLIDFSSDEVEITVRYIDDNGVPEYKRLGTSDEQSSSNDEHDTDNDDEEDSSSSDEHDTDNVNDQEDEE